MEIKEVLKGGTKFAARLGSITLTGVAAGAIIAAGPAAAPLVICEKLAMVVFADKIACIAEEHVEEMFNEISELNDEFKDLWEECKEEAESR